MISKLIPQAPNLTVAGVTVFGIREENKFRPLNSLFCWGWQKFPVFLRRKELKSLQIGLPSAQFAGTTKEFLPTKSLHASQNNITWYKGKLLKHRLIPQFWLMHSSIIVVTKESLSL
jgi:hypothetical protein